jgi:prophage regulatory protein
MRRHETASDVTVKQLLRMRDLKAEYGLVPATVYRWISEGHFPAPVNLGSNTVAWHREEIENWRLTRPRANVRRPACAAEK